MSSSRKGHGNSRVGGGGGGFQSNGAQSGPKRRMGVSLGNSEVFSGSKVNNRFRESGADNIKKRKKVISRKDKRKMAKEERKQRTQTHELWKQSRKLGVSMVDLEEQQSNEKKRKREEMLEEEESAIPEYQSEDEELEERPAKKVKSRAEEADDAIIRSMEKKLGLRGKKKNKIGDGLDFLFEDIGDDAEHDEGDEESDNDGDSSNEGPSVRKPVDPKSIFGKGWKRADQAKKSEDSDEESQETEHSDDDGSDVGSGSDDENLSELSENEDIDGDSDVSGEDMEEEAEEGSDGSDFGLGFDDGSTDSSDDGTMFGSGNPYITRDEDSDEEDDEEDEEDEEVDESESASGSDTPAPVAPTPKPGAYIPPALRARMAAANGVDDKLEKMSRELRGLVNRLSDSNIEAIFEMIEGLFSKYSRKAVNDELVKMFLDDCIASVGGATVFTFAPTYAALTMMLHLTIGAEVGGNVVQGSARELQRRLDANDIPVSRNLLLLFINFYNYSVVHCSMVYDIIRVLIKTMNEQNVDLLLLLIQRCGSQLRKDDPGAIKDMIGMVNEVTSAWKEEWDAYAAKNEKGEDDEAPKRGKFTKRVQFMIESLNDVKNNKIVARESDATTMKMKDAIETYWKKRFKSKPVAEPIRIAWNDLISSDHLGRWWVVGSATQIPSDQRAEVRKEAQLKKAMNDVSRGKADEVDALARSQHMTSATRKAIFSIIVTSEDYIDACEKLTRFNPKDVKPREVIQVLLQCCQQESSWNPYYATIAEKLCAVDPHYRISLKFLLWEKFDDMESSSVRALTNLAKLFAYLIGTTCMLPTVLKAFPFEGPSPKAIVFLRMLLASLFLEFDHMAILKQFVQCSNSKDFAELAQHLDIFIQQNMKALSSTLLKHCRIHAAPHKISDSSASEHVSLVCASVRKTLSQASLI